VLQLSPATVGVVYIIATLINVVQVAGTGRLGDKIGRLNTILVVGIISLIASQLLFRTPYFVGVGESISVIAFSTIMYCLWVWAERPLDSPVRVWVAEVIPTAARGSVQGILDFVKSLIGSVLSIAVGYLAAAIGVIEGYSLMPLFGGIFGLAVVTMLKRKGFETKGKALA
jgi:MFS family permease